MSPPHFAGKLADPDFRTRRARKAAEARTSVDHHIDKIIESAPALTAEQVERIRGLLPAATRAGDADG